MASRHVECFLEQHNGPDQLMPDRGRVSRSGSYTATDVNPPTCTFREARSTMDRNRHMASRTSHPVDNVHPVSSSTATASAASGALLVDTAPRTANYHFAAMRRAEQAASRLSVQYQARRFAAAFDPDATPDSRARLAELAATRDSYYLLAAAHRAAARKRERRENRALAWTAFKEGPAAYVGCTVRSWAYRVLGAVNV
jgi:hypothetical protein